MTTAILDEPLEKDPALDRKLGPDPAARAQVKGLYEQGLYLQAFNIAQTFGPIKDWTGTDAQVLGGRLANVLGGVKLASWMFIKAWRGEPKHADARWFYVRYMLEFRGALKALKTIQNLGDLPEATPGQRAQWLAQHASLLGRLRDFDAADKLIRQAQELDSLHPWIQCEASELLIMEDRLEEALATARHALELRPWYRPAVQGVAHLLVQLERDEEALDLLAEACRRLESSHLWAQLASLQIELRQYGEARQSLEEYVRLSPLLEKVMNQWLASRRSDAAYFCGDLAQAVEQAKLASGPFFDKMAERLANPSPQARRVHLPVPFVRQHYSTCVPATLAAISRFWSMPGDHLEVAGEICYDGTPHHSERRWAEEHGWAVREFTVTWESAMALLDRGVPFTLTTTEPANSHLQAAVGYDSFRGTLLIRDPGERHQREFLADAFFERYRPTGPRGMALVPEDRAHLLEGLNLPDAGMYDQLYLMQRALQAHRRDQAEAAFQALKSLADNHYLTWLARRGLAQYDADPVGALACAEGLLGMFPEDIGWQIVRASCQRQLGQRVELMANLKKLAERRPTDTLCWQQYAQELSVDAREQPTAVRLLRLAMRGNPFDAGTYSTLARIRWSQRRFSEGLELDRFAACIGDKNEGLAQNYFLSARCLGKTEESLDFLRERFERHGGKSSLPARTLSWAYGQLNRIPEGLAVLDEAIRQLPEDGDLLVYAAEAQANFGYFERALAFLQKAEGKSQHTIWLRTAAIVAGHQGDRQRALALWQQALQAEPLHVEAHRSVSQLLSEVQGRAEALRHLEQACARFPHYWPLLTLWIEWLREDGPAAVEPVVRKLIAIHETDAWARRELALTLGDQGRIPEALAEMELAERLDPQSATTWGVKARVLYLAGRDAESRDANRQAIRLSVDQESAIRELLAACGNLVERREALAFVEQELMRQVIFGDGLLTFRDLALYTLEPEELLATLQKILGARPDLWHAWSAVIRQLTDMGRTDDALVLARRAVEQFPLLPALWLDLALVHRHARELEGEIEVLQNALEINPGWSPALRQLAEAYQMKGKLDKARELLELALTRAPMVAVNQGSLADILWKMDRKEEALDRIQQALRLDPGYEWAWGRLQDWSRKLEKFDLPAHVARDLTRRRPGEARSWLMLSRMLVPAPAGPVSQTEPGADPRAERLAAIDKTIALNPRLGDAYDIKAEILAQDRRFDEALAACRPAIWGERPPLQLRGRAAWVIAQQGDLPEACAQMRAVLVEDVNYYWAWTQLADWCQAMGAFEEYLKAAEEMVRLSPNACVPLGYRGEARLRLGQREAGREDLRKAQEIAPEYALAGILLFDELFSANELDKAEETLAVLKKHVGGPYVQARTVQLSAKRGLEPAACEALAELCQSRDPSTWPFDTAYRAMIEAGWEASVDRVIREAVRQEYFDPNVAAAWGQNCPGLDSLDERLQALDRAMAQAPDYFRLHDIKAELLARAGRWHEALAVCKPAGREAPLFLRGRAAWIEHGRGRKAQAMQQMEQLLVEDPTYYWGCHELATWYRQAQQYEPMFKAAAKMLGMGANGRQGMVDLARALARSKKTRVLHAFVGRFSDDLRRDTPTWGGIGCAFADAHDDAAMVKWMHDWAERRDAPPWMLVNLAISLRSLGRDEEAHKVSLHALAIPADYTLPFHKIWLCLDEALAGNRTALTERLDDLDPAQLDAFHAFVAAMVKAIQCLMETQGSERDLAFAAERQRLADAAAKSEPILMEVALQRTYRMCVTTMARLQGGLAAKMWSIWRCWQPLLPRATES